MLRIALPASEYWDEKTETFIYGKAQVLQLEHSLNSVSKWESKHHKAFLGKQEKSNDEWLDYIRCMTLTEDVDPSVYSRLTDQHLARIKEYMEDPMSSTYFAPDKEGNRGRDTITAELIYYWMTALNIPFECQEWHLNRLFALMRVCSIKNAPPKKMNRRDIMNRNAALNAQRKKRLGTRG